MLSKRKYITVLLIVILVLITVAVRYRFLLLESNKKANPQLIILNGEAAHNLIRGKGFVMDSRRILQHFEQENKVGHMIDPEDIKISEQKNPQSIAFYDERGYPLFLAALWKITGSERFLHARLFQIMLAAISVIIIFVMGRFLFSNLTAFLAGLFYALYMPEAQLSVLPIQHAWVGFIAIFSVCIILTISKNISWKKKYILSILLGIIIGIGAQMRSTLVLFPIIGIIAFFSLFSWKKALPLSTLMILFFSIILSPTILWNKAQFGEARPVRKVFWHSIAVGLGQFPNPWGFLPIDGSVGDYVQKKYGIQNIPSQESEEVLKNEITEYIQKNPLWYVATIIERIPLAIVPLHWTTTQGQIETKIQNGERIFFRIPYKWGDFIWPFRMTALVLITFIGVWFARHQWRRILPLLLVWGYFIAVYSAIFVQPGYLYPLSFIYALFSAYALEKLWRWVKLQRSLQIFSKFLRT